MLVREAKAVAQKWVEAKASQLPGFVGAFFVGSTNWMHDDDPMPPASDLDIHIVLDTDKLPTRFNELGYGDLLLDIAYTLLDDVRSPQAVLSKYPLAPHFTRPCIITDPTGHLGQIQAVVVEEYARRKWVLARVEAVTDWQLGSLESFLDTSAPLHDQVFAWLYATSIFCHMILVADLKNPTTRKMLVAARQVLAEYDQLAFHESVLELFGFAALSRAQVDQLLENLADVFENAKAVCKTEFFGSSKVREGERSTILGGIEEIISLGYHREAVFWLLVIHTWCQKILYNDASAEVQSRLMPQYEKLLNLLGITSLEDVHQRIEQVKAFRPQAVDVVEHILAQNPEIFD